MLVLENSTYGHYAYVSLAGLATATAASLDGLAQTRQHNFLKQGDLLLTG